MQILTTNAALTSWLDGARARPTIVPTMGALHAGHGALIARAREVGAAHGSPCLVTIFVNPTQFNDPADLARYPRSLDADLALAAAQGADAVFAPEPAEIYPPDQTIGVPVLPRAALAPKLEDACRPGHFAGVCQVVKRLFELTRARAAVFGEKDWQQLQVVIALVAQERMDVQIIPHGTVREVDGLAMSSRNRFLTPEQRAQARAIPAAWTAAGLEEDRVRAEDFMRRILRDSGLVVQYAVIRDAETLERVQLPDEPDGASGLPGVAAGRSPATLAGTRSGVVTEAAETGLSAAPAPPERRACRALIAAALGSVRLLDNAPWPLTAEEPTLRLAR